MPHAHPCVLCLPCGVSKSYNPNPKRLLCRPPLKNVPLTPARARLRRVQCVCQNEVEKMRRAYCLNPKRFGLIFFIAAFFLDLFNAKYIKQGAANRVFLTFVDASPCSAVCGGLLRVGVLRRQTNLAGRERGRRFHGNASSFFAKPNFN